MDSEYRFEDEPAHPEEEALEPAPETDAFARMVEVLRRVSGYDPGAEDEPEDELSAARTRRWIGRTVLFATLTLAVLNAPSIRSWAVTLPPTWGSETVRQLAEVWDRRLAEAGLDGPRRAIKGAYDDLKGQPGEASGR